MQVAVTARWRAGAAYTEKWLADNDLAGLPLMCSARPHPTDASRVAYKRDAIEYLRVNGWEPIMGIGDRPSDLRAYTQANVRALMVCHRGPLSRDTPAAAKQRVEDVGRLRHIAEVECAPQRESGALVDVSYWSDCPAVHAAHSDVMQPPAIATAAVSPDGGANATSGGGCESSSTRLPSVWSQIAASFCGPGERVPRPAAARARGGGSSGTQAV